MAGKKAAAVVEPPRTQYLGGSDAASVLGVSHWKTPYQLWCEKVGIEVPKDLSGIDYVYFGNLLEPIVAQVFCERLGFKVRVVRKLYQHPKYPFLCGHIDRDILGEDAFLECKTANAFDYRDWGKTDTGSDGVPKHYLAQVDHYMMVRNNSYSYVAALIGGNEFRWYKVERDAGREKKMLDLELKFWELVQKQDPPDVHTERDARHRWAELLEGTSVAVDLATRAKIARLSKVASDKDALDKEEKALRNWLFPLFQDKEYISDDKGVALARLSAYNRTGFELDEFREKHPKIAKKFTKTKPAKRLKILI